MHCLCKWYFICYADTLYFKLIQKKHGNNCSRTSPVCSESYAFLLDCEVEQNNTNNNNSIFLYIHSCFSLWPSRRMPSLLEYLSYNCNFMGILAGPTCSYNDYMAFIEGTCYQPRHQENANGQENGKHHQIEPSPKVEHKLNLETEFSDV